MCRKRETRHAKEINKSLEVEMDKFSVYLPKIYLSNEKKEVLLSGIFQSAFGSDVRID